MSQDFYMERHDFIQIFKFNRSTEAAIRQWSDALDQYVISFPKSEPFYILLDVTGDHVEFTATARQAAKDIFSKHRGHVGYLAMLFEWRTSPYFARLFFASLGRLQFELSYFADRDQAIDWLQAQHNNLIR